MDIREDPWMKMGCYQAMGKKKQAVSRGARAGRGGWSGRDAALEVLRKSVRGKAFIGELLESEFYSRALPPEERRLATELSNGCTRRRGTLDRVIEDCAGRKISKISPGLRDLLRLGMYQLIYCDRIPPYAAVSETVESAKRHGPPGAEKFVNAVLRRAPRSPGEIRLPADTVQALAVAQSMPPWLVKRWVARWGPEEAAELCRAQNGTPPMTARVNRLRCDRNELIERIGREGGEARANGGHPLAVDLGRFPTPLREMPSFRDGLFQIQDVSGMRVVDLVRAHGGETVVDLCAAPGGKATGIAEEMGDRGRVICVDLSKKRAGRIMENARRLGLSSLRVVVGDGREAAGFPGCAGTDRVIIDAPCSNTGVLRRRPEARWRLREGDIARLSGIQRKLLAAGASIVRPGGVLIYSSCSVEIEENEDVARDFARSFPEFSIEREVVFLPHRDDCDGGYAARFVRTKK